MTLCRFSFVVEFILVAIFVPSFLFLSIETSALAQTSEDFDVSQRQPKALNTLVDLLEMSPELIHMEIVKVCIATTTN